MRRSRIHSEEIVVNGVASAAEERRRSAATTGALSLAGAAPILVAVGGFWLLDTLRGEGVRATGLTLAAVSLVAFLAGLLAGMIVVRLNRTSGAGTTPATATAGQLAAVHIVVQGLVDLSRDLDEMGRRGDDGAETTSSGRTIPLGSALKGSVRADGDPGCAPVQMREMAKRSGLLARIAQEVVDPLSRLSLHARRATTLGGLRSSRCSAGADVRLGLGGIAVPPLQGSHRRHRSSHRRRGWRSYTAEAQKRLRQGIVSLPRGRVGSGIWASPSSGALSRFTRASYGPGLLVDVHGRERGRNASGSAAARVRRGEAPPRWRQAL